MEWASAFGNFGTLIPFMIAYISLLKILRKGWLQ